VQHSEGSFALLQRDVYNNLIHKHWVRCTDKISAAFDGEPRAGGKAVLCIKLVRHATESFMCGYI
jgi:DNA-nicking Smr family endonuclease